MPAIAQTLLFVAALGSVRKDHLGQSITNQSDPRLPENLRDQRSQVLQQRSMPERTGGWTFAPDAFWPAAVISLIALALFTGCWYSGLGPVLNTRAWIASGKLNYSIQVRPTTGRRRELAKVALGICRSPESNNSCLPEAIQARVLSTGLNRCTRTVKRR